MAVRRTAQRCLALLQHANIGKSLLACLLGLVFLFSKFEVDATYQLLHHECARVMHECLVQY